MDAGPQVRPAGRAGGGGGTTELGAGTALGGRGVVGGGGGTEGNGRGRGRSRSRAAAAGGRRATAARGGAARGAARGGRGSERFDASPSSHGARPRRHHHHLHLHLAARVDTLQGRNRPRTGTRRHPEARRAAHRARRRPSRVVGAPHDPRLALLGTKLGGRYAGPLRLPHLQCRRHRAHARVPPPPRLSPAPPPDAHRSGGDDGQRRPRDARGGAPVLRLRDAPAHSHRAVQCGARRGAASGRTRPSTCRSGLRCKEISPWRSRSAPRAPTGRCTSRPPTVGSTNGCRQAAKVEVTQGGRRQGALWHRARRLALHVHGGGGGGKPARRTPPSDPRRIGRRHRRPWPRPFKRRLRHRPRSRRSSRPGRAVATRTTAVAAASMGRRPAASVVTGAVTGARAHDSM